MSDSPVTRQPIGTLQEILQNAKPEDFDGHTEFHRLTPEQRIAWLDQAVAFIQTAKKRPAILPNARATSMTPMGKSHSSRTTAQPPLGSKREKP